MQELAFGTQQVDFEKGADNTRIERKRALFNYVARVFSAGSSIVNNVRVIVTTIEALNNFKLTGKN